MVISPRQYEFLKIIREMDTDIKILHVQSRFQVSDISRLNYSSNPSIRTMLTMLTAYKIPQVKKSWGGA